MSETGVMVVKATSQSMAFLGDFLKLLAAWEIPINSIKSEAGGMFTNTAREITEYEWARHKHVMFPRIYGRAKAVAQASRAYEKQFSDQVYGTNGGGNEPA